MTSEKDYLGDKLRLVERAREDTYFRKLDQELIHKMRQQAAAQEEVETVVPKAVSDSDNAFSRILVPVDFSPYSMRALEKAAALAEPFSASIIALHVIATEVGVQALAKRLGKSAVINRNVEAPETISDDDIETVIDHHREQAYKALQAFLPSQLAKYSVELRVLFGRPFERIVETAEAEDVAVIVMGTHGRTGLAHLGSIAERVVRLAPCAVLTVKAETPQSESWLKNFYASFLGIGSPEEVGDAQG